PHLWLDPIHAEAYVGRINVALADAEEARGDRDAEERLRSRSVVLGRTIMELDQQYAGATRGLRGKSFIAFHGAFGYLAQRYGLDIAGVWQKTPGREPSPHEVQALLRTARASNVKAL